MSLVFTPEGTPASPVEGEVYYDSTADKLKVRDASAFREVVSKNSSGEIDGTFSGALSTSTTGGGVMSVGTVSESSGTPTGDIIQRGSSANGEYVRYADGTQICVIRNISPSTGSDVTWTFPAAFASGVTPTTAGTSTGNDQTSVDRIATNGTTALSNTAWVFRLWNLGGGSDYPSRSALDTNLSAIGRWF